MARPVRVLYVDHTAKIGGGEIALLNLVRHLDRNEVEPVVLLFEDGPLAERLSPEVQTRVLPLDETVSKAQKGSLGLGSLTQIRALWLTVKHIWNVARTARELKVDLIHTNSLKADIIGGIAGRLAAIPVVWHVRDRISPDYLPSAVVHVFRFLCRTIPQFVIANSRATLDTVQLRGRRPSAAIGSGVDLGNRYNSLQAGQETNSEAGQTRHTHKTAPLIGLVGRISPWKGQHIFLQAAAQILKRFPLARFELIGAALFAEREYEDSLHQLCRELAIEASVDFVGFVEDVPSRVATLDIFVHASTTGEPFGQVIVEAMAAAKPVVATNGGGVPEIVVDGVTGLLVPMGDAERMAGAVEYLLDHPEEAHQMGRRGQQRVLDQFTIQKSASMVQEVYRQVLHR